MSARDREQGDGQEGIIAPARAGRRRLFAWGAGAGAAAAAALTGRPANVAAQPAGQVTIAGSWRATVVHDDAENVPFNLLATFTADGSYLQHAQPGQSTAHGSWQRTGDRTFALTFEQFWFDQETGQPDVNVKVRADIQLDTAGTALTARFQFEFRLPDGSVRQAGMGHGEGTRILVERI